MDRPRSKKTNSALKIAAIRGEVDDLPARCISLLQQVEDLIKAHNSGQEKCRRNSFHVKRKIGSGIVYCATTSGKRHPPFPLLPLQDLQRPKNRGPIRAKRLGFIAFSALGLHKLYFCPFTCAKKLPCRVLDSDTRKWSFSFKGTALDVKPDWKACSQNWKPLVGLNCWEVGHLAQCFR